MFEYDIFTYTKNVEFGNNPDKPTTLCTIDGYSDGFT